MQPLVFALGDLQVQSGALAVNHYRSRVEQLLASTVIGSEAAHHAKGEEELACQRTGAIGNVDHAAEINAVEIGILGKIIKHRAHEVGSMLIEGERRQFVTRCPGGCIQPGCDR